MALNIETDEEWFALQTMLRNMRSDNNLKTVTIPKSQYDEMQEKCRQYDLEHPFRYSVT